MSVTPEEYAALYGVTPAEAWAILNVPGFTRDATGVTPVVSDPTAVDIYGAGSQATSAYTAYRDSVAGTLSPGQDWPTTVGASPFVDQQITQEKAAYDAWVAGGKVGPAPTMYWTSTFGGGAPSTTNSSSTDTSQAANALTLVKGMFPWLANLGLDQQILEWSIQGLPPEGIVANVRNSSQYKSRFVGIFRPNGEMRMSESEYLNTEEQYRQLMRQYFRPDYEYNDPNDFKMLFDSETSVDELSKRFQVYDQVRTGSQDVKDAFYVYAGLKITDDDLYNAVVNPEFRDGLTQQYTEATAKQPLDYSTWITRATEAGLSRVVQSLTSLQSQGVDVNNALAAVSKVDPTFAQSMMDVLLHGGSPNDPSRYLSLNEALHSFEIAMIGGAASLQGLALPTADRAEAFRQAGIDRAKALETYGKYATNQNFFSGAVQRAQLGTGFTQSQFENAVFLSSASDQQLLERALSYEKSLGETSGSFGFSVDQAGRLQQRGLQTALS